MILRTGEDFAYYLDEGPFEDEEDIKWECPICGTQFNAENLSFKTDYCSKVADTTITIVTCPNKKCNSQFLYTCTVEPDIEFEEEINMYDMVGKKVLSNSISFIKTPNIASYLPQYIVSDYILAHRLLAISAETAGVYVRRCLELFISNQWSETNSLVTKTKKGDRHYTLDQKIKWLKVNKKEISSQDIDYLYKIKNTFNKSAHAGEKKHTMQENDVILGLTILLTLVRKYQKPIDVSSDLANKLDLLNKQMTN